MTRTSFQITRDQIKAANAYKGVNNETLFAKIQQARAQKSSEISELTSQAVELNIGLVSQAAKGFLNKGLDDDDIYSEGIRGLIDAVKGYNPKTGYKFSTYATTCIKNSIKKALADQSRTIRIPNYLSQIKRKTAEILVKHSDPSIEELVTLVKAEFKSTNTKRLVHSSSIGHCLRLIKMERKSPETIENKEERRKETTIEEKEQLDFLNSAIKELDDRTAEIFNRRFGLNDFSPQTLQEIGTELGLTRERVRQIETEGMQMLRKIYKRLNTPTGQQIELTP